jgi:hypothetical protein
MSERPSVLPDPALADLERARADLSSAIARGDMRMIEALRVRYEALEGHWRVVSDTE